MNSNGYAYVFIVLDNGNLNNNNVNNNNYGVRPISFYHSYTWLRFSIAELGYKINPEVILQINNADVSISRI